MLAAISRMTEIITWLHAVAPAAQLSSDSRSIATGDVFFAYPGDAADGRRYIADAIEHGAQAVVYDDKDGFSWNGAWNVPHQAVTDLRKIAGQIANAYYSRPDADMFTV